MYETKMYWEDVGDSYYMVYWNYLQGTYIRFDTLKKDQ